MTDTALVPLTAGGKPKYTIKEGYKAIKPEQLTPAMIVDLSKLPEHVVWWERLPTETVNAYRAFTIHRDTPPERRSMLRTSRTFCGLDPNTRSSPRERPKQSFYIWRVKYAWDERLAAWDRHLDENSIRVQEQARLDMSVRHAGIAVSMQEKVRLAIEHLDPQDMDPSEIAKWVDTAVKVDRLARGEATEKVDIEAKVRSLAVQIGLDPDTAVAEALRLSRMAMR